MKQLIQKLTTERPWLIILLITIATIAFGAGVKELQFRGDYKVFFKEGYEPLEDFEAMERIFNKNDNVAILFVPESENMFDQEMLTMVQEYTDLAWQIPYSSRVNSLTNFQNTWSEYDDMVVEDLVYEEASTLSTEDLDKVKAIALKEPYLKGAIVSPDAKVALINVTLQFPDLPDTTLNVIEVMEYVQQLSADMQSKYPNVHIYHTGVIPLNYAFAMESKRDILVLVPAMLLLIIVLLALLMKSFTGMVATIVVLLVSTLMTMGFAGWAGFLLHTGTVNVPIVILAIGVADCVHIVASVQLAQKKAPNKQEAIRSSIDLNWMPIFITSVTTAIGLGTLMLSESPVFSDFGILAALGVMVAFFNSLVLYPALLTVMPLKPAVQEEEDSLLVSKIADFVIRYKNKVLVIGSMVVIGLSSLTLLNVVNDVPTDYFSSSTEFKQSVDKQEETLSGMQKIDFALYSDESGGVNNPEYLKMLRDFSVWLKDQPEVNHVTSIVDIYKRLNMNMHADEESWYRIPEDRETAAQYLLMYEMSLPYGLDLTSQLNIDKSSTRISVILANLGSTEMVDFEERSKAWIQENAPSIRVAVASPTLMFAHIGKENMSSMILSAFLALFIISGILIFALGSLRLGVISLVPNIAPALVGFGFWALISGEINLGLSIVTSMTIGIVVDYTVHFMSKYKRARESGMNPEESVRYSYMGVGRALFITTVVLSLGFTMFAFSSFRLNSDMGIVTAMIILIAFIVDMILLPPFLLSLDKNESVNQNDPSLEISKKTETSKVTNESDVVINQ